MLQYDEEDKNWIRQIEEQGGRLFYIDLEDGVIQAGNLIEYSSEGLWVRLKGDTVNTFVFSDRRKERVFADRESAEAGLSAIRAQTKARLLKNDYFIEDILGRLRKHEGNFYVQLIQEILSEKTGHIS